MKPTITGILVFLVSLISYSFLLILYTIYQYLIVITGAQASPTGINALLQFQAMLLFVIAASFGTALLAYFLAERGQ